MSKTKVLNAKIMRVAPALYTKEGMQSELKKNNSRGRILEIKDRIHKEALRILNVQFPCKILEIRAYSESSELALARIQDVRTYGEAHCIDENEPAPAKRPKGATHALKSNLVVSTCQPVIDIGNKLKGEIRELVGYLSVLQSWIQLKVPKIEDGNNFGVSVQEDIMSEIARMLSDVSTYMDQLGRYHATRSKAISKVMKYPFVEDYRELIKEIDEKEFVNYRFLFRELAIYYYALLDLISKNFEKIICPRSENARTMF